MDGLHRLDLPRSFAPRLSVQPAYAPCPPRLREDGTIPVPVCGAREHAPPEELFGLITDATAAIEAAADPDALHGAGLIELLWTDATRISLQRSISQLHSAARLSGSPAPILADLAAAYLVRAGQSQSVRDLMEAIESAQGAIDADPAHPAARYNLALALDWLGLADQARAAWRDFVRIDAGSEWAKEAELRIAELSAAAPAPPGPASDPAQVAAFVARAPQDAQTLGWDDVLGRWGQAVLAGDAAAAEAELRFAATLGGELLRLGLDATLADQVAAIRRRGADPAATRRLARQHADYAAARAAYRLGSYSVADTLFRGVVAGAPRGEPLYRWASVFRGGTAMYGSPGAGEPLLRRAVSEADSVRYPALAGRARWLLGTTLLRSSRYEEAWTEYEAARRALVRAGEHEHAQAVQNNMSVAENHLGLESQSYQSLHRALVGLRPHRSSTWLHVTLFNAINVAAGDGFPATTLRLLDEDTAVAARTGTPVYVAEARLARARFLVTHAQREDARPDVLAGKAAAARMADPLARGWFENQAREVEALSLRERPREALVLLDSIIRFWDARQVSVRMLEPLLWRADASLALGEMQAAEAELERALALLEQEREAVATASWRASLLESARNVFDRMVMLRVAAKQPADALRYLERGRASFAATGASRAAAAAHPRAPAGEVLVEYALIGDTLLTWTLADTTVHLTRATVDRDELARSIERTRSSLEVRASERALLPDLARLYDALVRPIEGRLGAPGTPVVIIADGAISGVPFSALLDGRRRYLVQDHPLRFAPSLTDAAHMPRAPSPAAERMVIVRPETTPASGLGRGRLPGARDEADALGEQASGSLVLGGDGAGREEVVDALRSAGVLHYAGHAVFDDERPEWSHLVLGPGGRAAQLTADEIQRMRLGQLRLVVLAACETLRSRSGSAGGFAGLSAAFLAAGASGVVGSLWQVDDELTRPLMLEFHRRYRQSGDAAASLRDAQLLLLQSPDPALRSPSAWAGFRYAGK